MRRPGSFEPGRAAGRFDWQPVRVQRAAEAVDERSQLRRDSMR